VKKKILFVINSLECGGAEKSLLSLLSLIDFKKYDVYLQMFSFGGLFESLLPHEVIVLPLNLYLTFCKKSMVQQLVSFNFKYLSARLAVKKNLIKNQKAGMPLHISQAYWKGCGKVFEPLNEEYDVAIAWGQGNPTHFVAEKVKAKKKIAWINADYGEVGYSREFDEAYYSAYNNIVCVSDMLSDKIKEIFPQYADRLLTIFDINNPDLVKKMSEEENKLPEKREGVLRLVTTGRLVQQKGYDIAVKAAGLLKERNVKFEWFVIGEGTERKKIEHDIQRFDLSECFFLMGAQSNPYPIMKSADIYVQTSKSEGFCITLTEARMLNKPCVTTNFDVVYNQIIDEKNGLIVEMNADGVADGIQRLMNDKGLYKNIEQYIINEKKGNVDEIEKLYKLISTN